MATTKRVPAGQEARDEAQEGGIGTLDQVLGGGLPEVEIDPVVVQPQAPQGVRMVTVRVNQDIEEMSWVAGGHRETYEFQTGHQYRVPVYIARELEALGKLWH